MTQVEYFRRATVLPLVVPLVLVGIRGVLGLGGIEAPPWLDYAINVLFNAMLFLGFPYALAAMALLRFLQGRSVRAYSVVGIVAPLIFALICELYGLLTYREHITADFLGYFLGVGYFYVMLAFTGLWLLRRLGWVRESDGPHSASV